MKKKLILVFIVSLFQSVLYAEEDKHPLANFILLSEAVPTEFSLMIEHLQHSELNTKQLKRFIVATELINKELSRTPNTNIMFLFKSEIYKGVLNNQYMKHNSLLQASTSILESTRHKLKKHHIVYTDFSKWIINSLLEDFRPFLKKNFINQYQNVKRSNSVGMIRAKRLQKIMKYLSPWLSAFDKNIPEDFNKLCTKIIIDTIERISRKTYYFKTFTGHLVPQPETNLFAIPQIKFNDKKVSIPGDEKSLKEEAEERKEKAEKTIKSLDPDDLSGASSDIDKLQELEE